MDSHTSIELRQAAAGTNLMARIISDWARGHGFDEDWEMADKLGGFQDGDIVTEAVVATLAQAADIIRRNVIAGKLMLIVTEVAECMESLRDTGFEGILTEGNFGEELSDIEIRVKHLAALVGVDLGGIEIAKIAKNETRPHKHGRKM